MTRPRSAEGNCLHSHHRGNLQCHSFVVTGRQPYICLVPAEPVSSRYGVTPDARHNLRDKVTKCHLILLIDDQNNKSLSDQPRSELKEFKEEPQISASLPRIF